MKRRYQDLAKEGPLRPATLEHTIRTGTAKFEADKAYVNSRMAAAGDGKVFHDVILSHKGVTLTELDLIKNYGTISIRKKLPQFYDIRKYPMRFADGQSLYSYLTDANAVYTIVEREKVEGTMCYVIERVRDYVTPNGSQKTAKERFWIAPEKGFQVKKAIAFSTKSPDKPLSITRCSLTQVNQGIWYYSKVTFESYPLFLPKPDVIAVLELDKIVVNQQLEENAFTVPFPPGCFINDRVNGVRYRSGSSLEKLLDMLNQLVDETFAAV
jgi:hypothetical protein